MRGIALSLMLLVAACGDAGTTTTTTTQPATTPPSTTQPAVSTSVATTTPTTEPRTTLVASDPFVTTGGLGPVRIGMTITEAREAAPYALVGEVDPDISETCFFVVPDDEGLEGINFMVLDGVIARVEVGPSSTVTTRSGAGIGLTDEQLLAMFPGQMEQANNATSDGVALAFVPSDEADRGFGVVFVLVDGEVFSYRSGTVDAIYLQEGCL